MTSKIKGGLAYGLPGLMLGLTVAWWCGGPNPSARAQAAPADANGTIAFTATSNGVQMLYLIDTRSQAFAIYRVDPTGAKGSSNLKLEAARQYRWDLRLSEFNNQPPEVSAIEAMVKSMAK